MTLENNVVHDVIKFGIIGANNGVNSIDNNIVNGVRTENVPASTIPYMTWLGQHAGLKILDSPGTTVTNNIVASTWHAGYMLQADTCASGTTSHTGNVAHSISGYGLIVQPPTVEEICLKFSDFSGYKTRIGTMHMGGGLHAKEIEISNIVTIDSEAGLMAFGGTDDGKITVSNSVFYGGQNMPNLDCPDTNDP